MQERRRAAKHKVKAAKPKKPKVKKEGKPAATAPAKTKAPAKEAKPASPAPAKTAAAPPKK